MAQVEVEMPKMGESIVEGTVIEWFKQPGDRVEQDEPLLEISTDKVDSEIPSPDAGYLKEVLVEEGDTVDVGTPIAVLVTEEAELEEGGGGAPAEPVSAGDGQDDAEEVDTDRESAVVQDGAEPASASAEETATSPPGGDEGEEVEVEMPKMGESIVEGTVIEWFKQPGDRVEQDEPLLEISTDKVDSEIPSPSAGFLKEILAAEGETVDAGTPIAIISTSEVSVTEGAAELSSEGEPAPAERSEQSSQEDTSADVSGVEDQESVPVEPSGDGAPTDEETKIPRRGPEGQFFSPLVRSIAEKEGISVEELSGIEGSGSGGRVTKEDVLAYLEGREEVQKRSPQPQQRTADEEQPVAPGLGEGEYEGNVEVVEMDRMRQVIADHMIHSQNTSAHVTSFTEADVSSLVELRERNKTEFQNREGFKLSYTAFFVQAAVEALREHPRLNASIDGNNIILKKDYHIGVAVEVGGTGLLVPVVRNAGRKNLVGIAGDIADLAHRARNKQLQPDELQGGTFTVTNVGSLGSLMGTPIINQPQVGILAPGAIKKRPVVIEDDERGDAIGIRHMMYLSLSYDHRLVDGAMAASFLQSVVDFLEGVDPDQSL